MRTPLASFSHLDVLSPSFSTALRQCPQRNKLPTLTIDDSASNNECNTVSEFLKYIRVSKQYIYTFVFYVETNVKFIVILSNFNQQLK